MVKVPEPLRILFETFPLKTYSPIPNLDSKFRDQVHHFGKKSSNNADKAETFYLGVHNVKRIEIGGKGKLIPTDPFSLADSLVLCHRHGLLLPSEDGAKSHHCIMTFSYQASPNNELPILIETSGDVTRSIRNPQEIRESMSINNFGENAQAFLVNQFLDNLNDLWTLILLADLPANNTSAFSAIFGEDPEVASSSSIVGLKLLKLVSDIPQWSSFKVRYAHLFDNKKSYAANLPFRLARESFLEVFAISDPNSLEKVYFEKLLEFERSLPLLWKYLESTEESEARTVIELKIVSFVICIEQFLSEGTHVGRMMRMEKLADIIHHSKTVLEKF